MHTYMAVAHHTLRIWRCVLPDRNGDEPQEASDVSFEYPDPPSFRSQRQPG